MNGSPIYRKKKVKNIVILLDRICQEMKDERLSEGGKE
jgi:hypothetical protein